MDIGKSDTLGGAAVRVTLPSAWLPRPKPHEPLRKPRSRREGVAPTTYRRSSVQFPAAEKGGAGAPFAAMADSLSQESCAQTSTPLVSTQTRLGEKLTPLRPRTPLSFHASEQLECTSSMA